MLLAFVTVTIAALPILAVHDRDASQATNPQAAIQAGRFAEASAQLRTKLAQRPSDPELWNLLGIAETELHHAKQAEEAFSRGLQLAPYSVALNENAGLFCFREARYGRAKQLLSRAIELGSEKPAVRFSLAEARLRSGEPEQALSELRALEPALSQAPQYWDERGQAELPRDAAAANQALIARSR